MLLTFYTKDGVSNESIQMSSVTITLSHLVSSNTEELLFEATHYKHIAPGDNSQPTHKTNMLFEIPVGARLWTVHGA